ncbi:MAG TPA: glycoside hydrolase family 88 protein [Lacunisphaera sp.]|jgi:unsaturated rhamnogalacturonyl hydrolase
MFNSLKIRTTVFALTGGLMLATAGVRAAEKFDGDMPLDWSVRMAKSEMSRRGDTMFYPNAGARWDYTRGFLAQSLIKLGERVNDPAMTTFGTRIVESFVTPEGGIATYKMQEYNIDMLPPGRALILADEQHKDEKIEKAIKLLRSQLTGQPRTSDGGFWHKQRYPHQMWLDGLFMGATFYAQYGQAFHEPAAFDDVVKQILLMDQHAYDPKTGLHYHAWDETHSQSWANKQTGTSPNFWGRAEGWYAMALVDCLDYLPPTQPHVEEVNEILRRVADGIVRWQDPKSGLWWQVLDQGDRKGNYLEATASCMFVYSLAKGINRGYLSREKYLPAVLKGYEGILRDFIRKNPDHTLTLTQCCEVAGLGFTNSKGKPRDGSFEYYVSEPIVENDLKGIPSFILAGIELDQLTSTKDMPFVVRGWDALPAMLAKINAPQFPAHDFPITDFGAKPGAEATTAIAAAIDACAKAGGGRVVVPAGEWLTAAIRLKSGVNLHVSEGATLKFIFEPEKYPVVFTRWEGVECMNYSAFIYAFEQENIAVTGKGTLDGGANWDTWWGWNRKGDAGKKQKIARDKLNAMGEEGVPVEKRVFGDGGFLRPNFIQPYRCKNILIEGVTIVNSPMWELNPELSENITVRGVQIHTHGPNNDGCDPESSRDILIEKCVFDTGDDCIAIKSGRNNDGRRVNVPSENIVIRDCVMQDGHGGVVLGSECTGGIRNVLVENCQMDSPNLDRALRFKDNAVRGGTLENVFMRHVRVGRVGEAILTVDLLYEEGAKGSFKPIVRNVVLDDVTSSGSPRVLYIRGFEGAIVDNIRISNSTFSGVTATDVVQHAGTITFQNVSIIPEKIAPGLNSRPAAK